MGTSAIETGFPRRALRLADLAAGKIFVSAERTDTAAHYGAFKTTRASAAGLDAYFMEPGTS
jgi:hypothetical protein